MKATKPVSKPFASQFRNAAVNVVKGTTKTAQGVKPTGKSVSKIKPQPKNLAPSKAVPKKKPELTQSATRPRQAMYKMQRDYRHL